MTWTKTPADLFGPGNVAVRPCTGIDIAVSSILRTPVTPVPGTGLPFGGTAVRLRPELAMSGAAARTTAYAQTTPRTTAFAHNSIAVANDGTPLGIHPSRRPQS